MSSGIFKNELGRVTRLLPALVVSCLGPLLAGQQPVVRPLLLTTPELAEALPPTSLRNFDVLLHPLLEDSRLVDFVADGGTLVWIAPSEGLPADLWVKGFGLGEPRLSLHVSKRSPLVLDEREGMASGLESAYVQPPVAMPYHNVDEEIRADFIPILEARDRFGRLRGYPGVLLRHNSASTVLRRFNGARCYFFFFEHPERVPGVPYWASILASVSRQLEGGLELDLVQTDYASYQVGERVQIRSRVHNREAVPAAGEIRFFSMAPGETSYSEIVQHRRVPDGFGVSEVGTSFRPASHPGLWRLRVEIAVDPSKAHTPAFEGTPRAVARKEIGFVQLPGALTGGPRVSTKEGQILIEGEEGFWTGTHYYPSSSWWDWMWRDFRPLEVQEDFSSMRGTGYRIVRVWIDPILDEEVLRAMDAAVFLAAQSGIVLDVCLMTQWPATLGFERSTGEHVRFPFRKPGQFNLLGISLQNLDLQREYIQILAARWRDVGNLIYNLSNETFVRDPDEFQMDDEALSWDGIPRKRGILRDTLLFRRWAREMTAAIRQAGGKQPVVPGYLFSLQDGGDSFTGDRDGDMASWHGYTRAADIAAALTYFDPGCTGRPILLEEFGTVRWNDRDLYDAATHYALGAGAAAALSYEWGVRWLTRETGFHATPLREILESSPEPREFEAIRRLAEKWPAQASGLHPAPSGFTYGSSYHGTPFPADAALSLGQLGLGGGRLSRTWGRETTFLLVPASSESQRLSVETVTSAIKELWKEHVSFEVLQEECLGNAPEGMEVLIAPSETTSSSSPEVLERLVSRGVDLYSGASPGWKRSPRVRRVDVQGAEADVLTRPVPGGLLVVLDVKERGPVTVGFGGQAVTCHLDTLGLVLFGDGGVEMVEGNGNIIINGRPFCRVEQGRVFFQGLPGMPLEESQTVEMIGSGPTKVHFSRPVQSASVFPVSGDDAMGRLPTVPGDARVVVIDGDSAHSIVRIQFR